MHLIQHLIEKRWSPKEWRQRLRQSFDPSEAATVHFLGLDSIFSVREALSLAQNHGYQIIQIPKRRGFRSIAIPSPVLLHVQKSLLYKLQPLFTPHACAHGFVSSRSPKTHAQRLAGSKYLLRIDIKHFFPSCTQIHILDAFDQTLPQLSTSLKNSICYLASYWLSDLRPTIPQERLRRVFNKCAQLREPVQRFLFQHFSIAEITTLREMSRFSEGLWSLQHLRLSRVAQRRMRQLHHQIHQSEPLNFDICRPVRLYYLARIVQALRDGYPLPKRIPTLTALVQDIENQCQPNIRRKTLLADLTFPVDLRALPQGGALSPWISNLIAHPLDQACLQYARSHNLVYSRYADDLCFGGEKLPDAIVRSIIQKIEQQALRINREKILIRGPGQQLKATGLIINQADILGVRLPKKYLRWLRAVVHTHNKGQEIHHMDGSAMSLSQLRGHLSYVQSIQPQIAQKLKKKLQ